MFKKIVKLEQVLLLGKSMKMSLIDNQTQILWQKFMPLKRHICNTVSSDMYSMQIYDGLLDFENFDPSIEFTKWAAVEVKSFSKIPEGLDSYVLQGGLYAVFIHQGLPEQFHLTFTHIFQHWLPNSDYQIDNREHFELLPENYRPDDPDATEEVWVPVVLKPIQ